MDEPNLGNETGEERQGLAASYHMQLFRSKQGLNVTDTGEELAFR